MTKRHLCWRVVLDAWGMVDGWVLLFLLLCSSLLLALAVNATQEGVRENN